MHSRVFGAFCIGDHGCHGHNGQLPVQKAPGSLHVVVVEISVQVHVQRQFLHRNGNVLHVLEV